MVKTFNSESYFTIIASSEIRKLANRVGIKLFRPHKITDAFYCVFRLWVGRSVADKQFNRECPENLLQGVFIIINFFILFFFSTWFTAPALCGTECQWLCFVWYLFVPVDLTTDICRVLRVCLSAGFLVSVCFLIPRRESRWGCWIFGDSSAIS